MKNFASVVGATVLGVLVLASPAAAADPVSFSCKASAVIATIAGASPVNPITAGGEGKECQNGVTGLPNVGEAVTLEDIVTAKTAYAIVEKGGEPPIKSKPTASAGVEDLALTIGGPVLGVGAARSSITGSCQNGTPQFETFSEVANISLAGFPLVLDGVVQPITDAVSDGLGALVSVRLNEVEDLPDGGKVVRAAHIKLLALDGSSAPLADIVIAESKLDLNGAACDPSQPPNNGDGDGDDGLPQICPDGAVYDVSRNVCVIAVPGSQTPQNPSGQLTGPGSVIVGPPSSGPSGGTVITLQQARKRFPKAPCVRGGGPRYVLVGTKGRDNLTGTNRRDRMIGRGGKDRLDAGRKADCVQGDKGRDRLSGGQGRDRMYGGKGKDGFNGGQQPDRLYGGKGRDLMSGGPGSDLIKGNTGPDYLNAAYGRDRLYGGPGDDAINAATAGVRQKAIRGGKGFDKVRCNPRDVKNVGRDVERVIVTKKIRG